MCGMDTAPFISLYDLKLALNTINLKIAELCINSKPIEIDEMMGSPDNDDEHLMTIAADDTVTIYWPEDEESTEISLQDFMYYADNIDSLQISEQGSAAIGLIEQIIVMDGAFAIEQLAHYVYMDDNVSIKFVANPFVIGIVATANKFYNKEWSIYPCSTYGAIEIRRKNANAKTIDRKLIVSFLLRVSYLSGFPCDLGGYIDCAEFETTYNEHLALDRHAEVLVSSTELAAHCPCMPIFIKAMGSNDEDIKFLQYYKIIEQFSTLAGKKHSYEQMNRHLDSLSLRHRSSNYLDSIFQLARAYQSSLSDKELCFTVMKECVELSGLLKYLPSSILARLGVKNKSTHQQCTEECELKIKQKLSLMLYATRNTIVHAKGNFKSNGSECPPTDLKKLNTFMHELCYLLFLWNSRQDPEYRVQ